MEYTTLSQISADQRELLDSIKGATYEYNSHKRHLFNYYCSESPNIHEPPLAVIL